MTDQSGGDGRLVQDRAVHRRQLARAESAHGAQARLPADFAHDLEVFRRAGGRVPVVALHRTVLFANHRTVDAVTGARVSAAEAIAVGVDKLRFVQRHGGAFGVDQASIDSKRRRLAFASQRDRLVDA